MRRVEARAQCGARATTSRRISAAQLRLRRKNAAICERTLAACGLECVNFLRV